MEQFAAPLNKWFHPIVTIEISCRTVHFDLLSLMDEKLVLNAEVIFLEFDCSESQSD